MYAVNEAFSSMRRTPVMTLVSLVTITITLTVFCAFGITTVFLNAAVDKVRGSEEINVYLHDFMPDEDMLALDAVIASMKEVESTRILSKEDARKEFEDLFGEDLISILGDNPLPRTIVINMDKQYRMALDLENVATRIKPVTGVDTVEYGREWMARLDIIFIAFLIGITCLVALAAASCMLIIANTISMTVLARKDTIEIMRLVGADDRFIRRPFYFEGLVQGVVAGILSFGLIYGSAMWIFRAFPKLISYVMMFAVPETVLPYGGIELAVIIPIGAIMGLFGSFLAVRRAF